MTSDARKRQAGESQVVSIDPDDREQVERLMDECGWQLRQTREDRIALLQHALRSLVAPPKPEEPTGLGAVVEDEKGEKWVRLESAPHWTCDGVGSGHYADIAAVRVLSDGVQP